MGKYLLAQRLAVILLFVVACNKPSDYKDVVSTDMTKPDPVTNVSVSNFPGGAKISYTIPPSKNVLYVLAEYSINDNATRETKTSLYLDTTVVEGFAQAKEYPVTLTVVSKANVKSDPVTVNVSPETPPYLDAYATLNLIPDFGGANATIKNKSRLPVGTVLLTYDSLTKRLVQMDEFYTQDTALSRSIRGYSASPRTFAAYVKDPFGNVSDTIIKTFTPLPEIRLDKSKFRSYNLPSEVYNWSSDRLWDDITNVGNSNGAYRGAGLNGAFPVVLTFDMGVSAQLSRYVYYQRSNEFAFANENSTSWTVWGSNVTNPRDIEMPLVSNIGDQVGDWINLGNFVPPPKPSGQPVGQNSAADVALADAGFEYTFSINNPPVRYIRMTSTGSYAGLALWIINELTFFGNPQ